MVTTAENKIILDIEELASKINMVNEESEYRFNGRKVPRVTKIIQRCNHNDGLMYWANSLGFRHQSYGKVINEAANIGTQCHNNIDLFLTKDDHKPENIMEEARNAYNSFIKWYNDISKAAKVYVAYHEKQITCSVFGGTLDGLYRINGKNYVVDYKTSNHITYNYCLQLAAYIYMLEASYLKEVDGCIILQLSKYSVGYNEYVLDFNNPNDREFMKTCRSGFLSMAYWYYYLKDIEQKFNTMKWGEKHDAIGYNQNFMY